MTARRVLVVDDDAEMSAMLARHLESEDMAVVAATGGREALKALTSQGSMWCSRISSWTMLGASRCWPPPAGADPRRASSS